MKNQFCCFSAEPPKPKVEQRVTIIREQVIDGKVVSSVVDTQTENVVQKK